MKNVIILRSVQEMQKNPLEKADFYGMMRLFFLFEKFFLARFNVYKFYLTIFYGYFFLFPIAYSIEGFFSSFCFFSANNILNWVHHSLTTTFCENIKSIFFYYNYSIIIESKGCTMA
jgi:hypothetical protein